MLDDNAKGLRLLVQLLDTATKEGVVLDNVNSVLFSMASNIEMLTTILDFVAKQEGSNLTTQRWLITMLAMLSSEKEWMEEVFLTDECEHPIALGTSYSREISIPLASKLHIMFDKRCSLEAGKQVLTITSDNAERKFTGETDWTAFDIEGGRFMVNCVSESAKPSWGYRLLVRPSFDNTDIEFDGRKNVADIVRSNALKLVLQSLSADDERIQLMASRALANMLFVEVSGEVTQLMAIVRHVVPPGLNAEGSIDEQRLR